MYDNVSKYICRRSGNERSPLFSDQYIAYYTETNEMKIYAFKSEKKALDKDVEKLQGQEMYRVTKGGKNRTT